MPQSRNRALKPIKVGGADVPMPYAKNLEQIAFPHEPEIVAAALANLDILEQEGLCERALELEPLWFRPYPRMNAKKLVRVYRRARELELPVIEMKLAPHSPARGR